MELWGPNNFLVRRTTVYKPKRETLAKDYRKLYRFDEVNVEWLASHFLREDWDNRGGGLSTKQQMQFFCDICQILGFKTMWGRVLE